MVALFKKEVNMKMKRFFASLLALTFALPLFAQYGKIVGRVVSAENGEPIPAAIIKIVSGPAVGGTYADEKGYYVLLRLPPGTYTLQAKAVGYKPQIIKNVVVEADHTVEVNFSLPSEAIEVEAVVVEAKEKIIRKDETESKAIIKGENIQNIPVASLEQAISLSSGVRVSGAVIQVRGGRPGEVSYVVDGVEITDPYSGIQTISLPLNAIQEASVSKGGFGAEYGSASSGVVQVSTKEGTEKYEASLQIFSSAGMGGFFNTNVGDPYMKYFQPPYFYGGDRYYVDAEKSKTGTALWNEFAQFDSVRAAVYNQKASEFIGKDPYFKDFATYFIGKDYFMYPWRENYFRPIIGIGGPLLPFYKALRFYLSYDYLRSNGTYPNTQGVTGSYQFKLSWFITPQLKIFFGSVGDNSQSGWGFDPEWRLLLTRLPSIKTTSRQFAFGVNYAFNPKTYAELRVGYHRNLVRAITPVDMDLDGVIDFTDRDGDMLVEVDLDMVRKIGRSVNPALINEEKENWVELKAWWWEQTATGLYPTLVKQTTRQNYFLGVVKGTNDTVLVAVGEYLYDKDGNPVELDTVFRVKDCYVPAEDTVKSCTTKMVFSNIYQPADHIWYNRTVYYTRKTQTWSTRFDFLAQDPLNLRGHEFKTGFEFYKYSVFTIDVDYASGGNIYMNYVDAHPVKFAYYIRDKMEFEGFIANVGFRFDYYDANAWVPADLRDPVKNYSMAQRGPVFLRDSAAWTNPNIRDTFFIKNPKRVPATFYVSPRIGISHPISESDVLHFTYGHYFQVPRMRWLYANQFWLMTGAFDIIGNPALKPEKTISYEVGIKHAFNPYTVLDVTAFYKDIADLVQSQNVQIGNTQNSYTTFVNQDFGSVRGLEFNFMKLPGGGIPLLAPLTVNISYTLQFAKATFASQYAMYRLEWLGIAPDYTEEHYVDWDQRHVINAVVSYDVPLVRKTLTTQFMTGYGLAFIYSYGSGTPYSPPLRSPLDVIERTNSMRLPSVQNVDFRLYKNFGLPFGATLRLFADIYNLLNDRTIVGYADINYYYYFGDPEGPSKHPAVYRRGRLTRYGLQITWRAK